MILKLYKKSHFTQITWTLIFAIVFAVPDFLQSNTHYLSKSTIFLKLSCLYPWIQVNWIYQAISNLLLIVLAFYVKDVFSRHQLVHRQNFLPSLLIIALFGFQSPFYNQLLSIINLLLLTTSFNFLLQSFDDEKPENSIFSASILLSIASFISYGNLLFFPLIWISFIIFQYYNWRHIPITLVGLITPYLFLFTWMFWHDKLHLLQNFWDVFYHQFFHLTSVIGLLNIIIYILLSFFIFSSLAKIIPETPSKIIAIRRKTTLSIWFIVIALYAFLFYNDKVSDNFILIPLAGLLGYYFRAIQQKRLWIDLLFSFLILILILNKYLMVDATKVL